jgi:hypothetical protein
LRKRSKKLLIIGFTIACGVPHAGGGAPQATPSQVLKNFLVLFLKKEPLPSPALPYGVGTGS